MSTFVTIIVLLVKMVVKQCVDTVKHVYFASIKFLRFLRFE